MGRQPGTAKPLFRFSPSEVAEMETILKEHDGALPPRDVLRALALRFSESEDRTGKTVVKMKQVWNWFHNKRHTLRVKSARNSGKLTVKPKPRSDFAPVRTMPPPTAAPFSAASGSGITSPESSNMEYEAKSSKDNAWYDVTYFLSYRLSETGDPEMLVQFAGFGSEESEWVNIRTNIRPRSFPCESSECVLVIPGDLILCFQESPKQALYFDAHVMAAQRRRHDLRGCRCRFLVQYLHDKSEEVVPLKKICRRPDTEYRFPQLPAVNQAAPKNQQKTAVYPENVPATQVPSSSEAVPRQQLQQLNAEVPIMTPGPPHTNVSQPPADVHGMTVTSSSEIVPKQEPQELNANIPITAPVPAPRIMNEDPKKVGTAFDVLSGNDAIVPPGFEGIVPPGFEGIIPARSVRKVKSLVRTWFKESN